MSDDPLIGKKLGAYEIIAPIGQGGMSMVYKATQPSMNRTVAIKVLSPQMAGNATFLARFKQEAQMIASLEHAHILPVYDLGEQDGLVYIAMRYLDSGSLQTRLSAGPLLLRDIGRWLLQVAEALDYAHQRGVIHRDVKPSNVLIDSQGNAFLADFGIAKWMEGSIGLTGTNVIGTPQYMSPEQGQGLKIDGRSDEYSLGVMAYELIVGRPPFEAETPLAIVLKHVTEPLTPPNAINTRVPKAVNDVIVKALAKRPDDRYPTVVAFAEALNEAIRTSPVPSTAPIAIAAGPTEQVHLTQTRPPRKPRLSRPLLIAGLGVIVIALGLTSAMLISANRPLPSAPTVQLTLGPNIQLETVTPAPLSSPTPLTTPLVVVNPESCASIYSETFDDPASGLPSGVQDAVAWGYRDGEYQLLVKAANFFQTRLMGPTLTDYEVNVEAHFASDSTGDYGIVVAARSQDDYLAFVVDANRNYAVTRRTATGSQVIQDWTFAPALNTGQAVNQLRAIQRGDQIGLYANGVLLKLVTDSGGPSADRQIGLTAASFGRGGVDARFDNLQICAAPAVFASHQAALIDSFDDNRNGWAPQRYSANGSSSIENGQFVLNAIYEDKPYFWSDWNPNVAFDNFELDADLQMTEGSPTSTIGIMFGVQDLNNGFLFNLINDGRFVVYRIVDGSYPVIAEAQSSAAIKPNLALNHIHLSVMSSTLSVAINNQAVLQAAIAYTPGYVGFSCGVYAPPQARCTYDNLAVHGTLSNGPLTVYPFCNCRREAQVGQEITTSWAWGAKTLELLQTLQAKSTLTVTLDQRPIDQPQQYWGAPQADGDSVQSLWSYRLPTLDAGSHVLEFTVHSDEALTDGLDRNGDGRPDTYGPGDFLSGYVEIVVLP